MILSWCGIAGMVWLLLFWHANYEALMMVMNSDKIQNTEIKIILIPILRQEFNVDSLDHTFAKKIFSK